MGLLPLRRSPAFQSLFVATGEESARVGLSRFSNTFFTWPLNNRETQRSVYTKDHEVFGIDAVVFSHHDIYREVGVDHLPRGVHIAGVGQNHIAIAAEKASRPVIITSVNGEPGVAPDSSSGAFPKSRCLVSSASQYRQESR